jgi:hypothetical protein
MKGPRDAARRFRPRGASRSTEGQTGVIRKGRVAFLFAAPLVALVTGNAFATLPFITDDAETLGRGTSQAELFYVGDTDRETAGGSTVKTGGNLPGATFGYGVAETLDLTLGFARGWGDSTVDGVRSNDPGSAAFTLSAKWNLFEKREFYVAVKPLVGYSYRVGGASEDHAASYGGWLIATKEHEALAVSLNGGFLYNDHGSAAERRASRSSIWILSALGTYKVLEGLRLGLDVGANTNPDKASAEMHVYALGGAICSLNEDVDLSLGLKFGITKPETDFAGIAGITVRF